MDIHEEKNKSQHKAGINWKKAKHYLFCCIPFFSNEFLERLTFWDWAPMIVGCASLLISILTYCSVL